MMQNGKLKAVHWWCPKYKYIQVYQDYKMEVPPSKHVGNHDYFCHVVKISICQEKLFNILITRWLQYVITWNKIIIRNYVKPSYIGSD